MGRVASALGIAIITFAVYIAWTGDISFTNIVFGILISLIVGALGASLRIVERGSKVLNPARFVHLLVYGLYYLFVIEPRAHLELMKLIFRPSEVRPAIVEIPYETKTEYSLLMLANSITNTPGTVTVEVDEDRKVLYVHWIKARTIEPLEAKKFIAEVFEKYSKKVFD